MVVALASSQKLTQVGDGEDVVLGVDEARLESVARAAYRRPVGVGGDGLAWGAHVERLHVSVGAVERVCQCHQQTATILRQT